MGAPEYPVKHEATIVLCNVLTVSEDPNQLMQIVKPSYEQDDSRNITSLLIKAINLNDKLGTLKQILLAIKVTLKLDDVCEVPHE